MTNPITSPSSLSGHAVIFDLDGTLADTAPDLLAALNHCVRDHNFQEFTLNEIGYLVGQGSFAMIKKAFELHETALNEELLNALHDEFMVYYEENISASTRLYPGVLDLMDTLQADGHGLCICTNKHEALAKKLLSELDILDRFAAVTGGDSFEFRKPDGRHLMETLKLANCTRGIMVGDTITDADAAKNAVMPLVLVNFGYSAEPVETFSPHAILTHFSEGYEAIKRLL